MTCTGYFLGSFFERITGKKIEDHIEKIILVVVFLSVLPALVGWLRARRTRTPSV
jgi:membrane protein DedA with SNARE-associated domain